MSCSACRSGRAACKALNMCEVASYRGRKGCMCWRAPGPSPSLPLARSLLIPPAAQPAIALAPPSRVGWALCIFHLRVCVCVLVLGKLMQLWELFSYFFYCHWQSLKPFETLPCWLVLCKKQGEGISISQMERDKTGVMICCNHAAQPTTVNYCCNNLLPVARGFSPGFFTSQYSIV